MGKRVRHKFDLIIRFGVFLCSIMLPMHNLPAAENDNNPAADFKSLIISRSSLNKLPLVEDDGENLASVELENPLPNTEPAGSMAFKLFQARKQFRWQPNWYPEGAGRVRIARADMTADGSVMVFGEVYGAINGPYGSRLVLISVKNRRVLKVIDLPNLQLTDFCWEKPDVLKLYWQGQNVLRQEAGIYSGVLNPVVAGGGDVDLAANGVPALQVGVDGRKLDYVVKMGGDDYYSGRVGGDGVLYRNGFKNILTDNAGLTAAFDAGKNILLLTIRKNDQLKLVNPANLNESEELQPGKIKPHTQGAIREIWVDNAVGGYLIFDESGNLYHLSREKKRWKKNLIFSAWR